MNNWVAIVALWAAVMLAILYSSSREQDCEDKGGVYLVREMKCVRGIEEVK